MALGKAYELLHAEYDAPRKVKRNGRCVYAAMNLDFLNAVVIHSFMHVSSRDATIFRHSVLGLGKTAPASSSSMIGDPEVRVPLGKCSGTKVKEGSLLYNEYIVYDEAQV